MNHQTIAPAHIAGMNVQFVRRSIADEIERLISILDQMDGDCDLEDSDDDANLAGDRFGDERELDLSDSEPSLGWTHCGAKGEGVQFGPQFWGDSYGDDREGDESDQEPDNEDEGINPAFEMMQSVAEPLKPSQWIAAKIGGAA
ncbi:hypothetical protein [Brucella pseudogrignonensis]|uniref:hypothetical protein n=1 Tax=Brucella pseudogrignonensis TaxID=419475 RepID=UPI003ED106D6